MASSRGNSGTQLLSSLGPAALQTISNAFDRTVEQGRFNRELEEKKKARKEAEKERKKAEKKAKKSQAVSLGIGVGAAALTGGALLAAAAPAAAVTGTAAAAETAAVGEAAVLSAGAADAGISGTVASAGLTPALEAGAVAPTLGGSVAATPTAITPVVTAGGAAPGLTAVEKVALSSGAGGFAKSGADAVGGPGGTGIEPPAPSPGRGTGSQAANVGQDPSLRPDQQFRRPPIERPLPSANRASRPPLPADVRGSRFSPDRSVASTIDPRQPAGFTPNAGGDQQAIGPDSQAAGAPNASGFRESAPPNAKIVSSPNAPKPTEPGTTKRDFLSGSPQLSGFQKFQRDNPFLVGALAGGGSALLSALPGGGPAANVLAQNFSPLGQSRLRINEARLPLIGAQTFAAQERGNTSIDRGGLIRADTETENVLRVPRVNTERSRAKENLAQAFSAGASGDLSDARRAGVEQNTRQKGRLFSSVLAGSEDLARDRGNKADLSDEKLFQLESLFDPKLRGAEAKANLAEGAVTQAATIDPLKVKNLETRTGTSQAAGDLSRTRQTDLLSKPGNPTAHDARNLREAEKQRIDAGKASGWDQARINAELDFFIDNMRKAKVNPEDVLRMIEQFQQLYGYTAKPRKSLPDPLGLNNL